MPSDIDEVAGGSGYAVHERLAHPVKVGKPMDMSPRQNQADDYEKHRDIDSQMNQVE